MSARAPAAIQQLYALIHSRISAAQLGGIVGDVNHSFGYHLARRDLPGSDYSVTLTLDKQGASDCASALDVTFGAGSPWMKTCTERLLTAAKARDPRLRALREFCGTLDGQNTYPWDLSTDTSEGLNSWDSSHLWHIHLSFYRAYADNWEALAPIADVFCGIPPSNGFLMALTEQQQHDMYARIMGGIGQRYYTLDANGVAHSCPATAPGAIAAHPLDTLDGNAIMQAIEAVKAEVDAIKKKDGA